MNYIDVILKFGVRIYFVIFLVRLFLGYAGAFEITVAIFLLTIQVIFVVIMIIAAIKKKLIELKHDKAIKEGE